MYKMWVIWMVRVVSSVTFDRAHTISYLTSPENSCLLYARPTVYEI